MNRILRSPLLWLFLGIAIFLLFKWIRSGSVDLLVAACLVLLGTVLQARVVLKGERQRPAPLIFQEVWQRSKWVLISMSAAVFIAHGGFMIAALKVGATSLPSWASGLLAWAVIFIMWFWFTVGVLRWRAKRYRPKE